MCTFFADSHHIVGVVWHLSSIVAFAWFVTGVPLRDVMTRTDDSSSGRCASVLIRTPHYVSRHFFRCLEQEFFSSHQTFQVIDSDLCRHLSALRPFLLLMSDLHHVLSSAFGLVSLIWLTSVELGIRSPLALLWCFLLIIRFRSLKNIAVRACVHAYDSILQSLFFNCRCRQGRLQLNQ